MASTDYVFVDHWRVLGTLEEVADILSSGPDLARWWPSTYLEVRILDPGNERHVGEVGSVYAKGWLPYTIRFTYRIVEERYPHGFTIEAQGDLTGRGVWTLEQDGPWVLSTYEWTIRADKPLLRSLSFFLKPLFRSNHNWTMRKGEESLKLELARRRARTPAELALIPAPPGPFELATWQKALASAGGVLGVWWLARKLREPLRVETMTVIRRPIEEVFAFVSDVTHDLQWQPEIREVRVTSEGPLGVGSTFREVRQTQGREFTWDMRITEFEPNCRICIESLQGTVPYQGCRLFEAIEGGTRITETSEVQLPLLLRPLGALIVRSSRRSVSEGYAKLKALLEEDNTKTLTEQLPGFA